ncbi:hypothetical protein CRENBAI_018601, partial [Crenichthys baileyi]
GTFFSGYTMDSWQQWKIVCLTTMSVADVENVYIFGLLITGFLVFGVGGYLAHRVIHKTWVQSIPKLPVMLDGVCRAINTQTEMLREQNRKLDTILEQNRSLAAVAHDGFQIGALSISSQQRLLGDAGGSLTSTASSMVHLDQYSALPPEFITD